MLVLKALRYIFLNQEQKLNSLVYLQWTKSIFCFSKNYSQPKPAEQLLSLNDLIQQNIDDVYIDGIDDVK